MVSVDVPVNSNRERNKRNGFTRPLRMTPGVMLDAMAHPAWVLRYLRTGGIPMMQQLAALCAARRLGARSGRHVRHADAGAHGASGSTCSASAKPGPARWWSRA